MPICAFDIWSDGRVQPAGDLAPTGPGDFRWLHWDLSDPELPGWSDSHLPVLAGTSLLQSETRPRCDAYEDGLILNLRGVNLNQDGPVDQMVSLRMWVTARTIVTTRKRRVFALDDIRLACLDNRPPTSIVAFLAQLIEGLSLRARDAVLDLDEQAEDLEELYDQDQEPDAAALQVARRKVIRMRRYLLPQREALNRLIGIDSPVTGSNRKQLDLLREATNTAALSSEALEALAARLIALQDFADARAARRQGRNGYALSVIAAIFLPLGFFTGLFGVNVAGMPGMNTPAAFAILCLSLLTVGVLTFVVLKRLRLL